ncbi:predicted protein [Histoplasma capsulatum G186AR]|uniref:Uncharacterized protein n=1 Tax=Ajellomyces capsulatus (strain G186AR / H82 / ATCC MYA-2454 / RMSCC 2432) TaxID=447093 RepID=C0NT75_AJECG|nr:uncharacterized protein HCBG_06355 [Histoplasma capsulatum G186AR]EEH05236.1 predicted protein [Histoplasma capsulatum G186AR]
MTTQTFPRFPRETTQIGSTKIWRLNGANKGRELGRRLTPAIYAKRRSENLASVAGRDVKYSDRRKAGGPGGWVNISHPSSQFKNNEGINDKNSEKREKRTEGRYGRRIYTSIGRSCDHRVSGQVTAPRHSIQDSQSLTLRRPSAGIELLPISLLSLRYRYDETSIGSRNMKC